MRKEAEEEEQNASLVYSPGRNGRAVIRVGEQFGGGAWGRGGRKLQLDTFEVHSTPILKCRHEEVPLFFFFLSLSIFSLIGIIINIP